MRIVWLLPVIGLSLGGPAPAAPDGEDKIDPQVRRMLQAGGAQPVILLGTTQFLEFPKGFDAFCSAHTGDRRSQLRRSVVAKLKEIAAAEQKAMLAKLKPASTPHPLWIVNAVAVSLTAEEVAAAAALPQVRYVYPGHDVLWDRVDGKVSEVITPGKREPFTTEGKKVPWNLKDIGAAAAWEAGATGEGTVVAILDAGVNYGHEDLRSNLWVNAKEIPNNGKDDDGNGLVDDWYGFDFAAMSPEVRIGGRMQHGTWTSGIVGGDGSGGTVTGVAPRTRLMILKAGGGTITAALAYQYALEQGADVMSMSFSLPRMGNLRGFWRMMSEQAVCAGLVLAGGAGNFQMKDRIPEQIQTPKDIPCVIAAGGVGPDMKVPDYVSLGPVEWGSVKFFGDHPMPAGLIKPDVTAFPGPDYPLLGIKGNSGYIDPNRGLQGNSFSGPRAAGVAALILGVNPELPAWRVKEILEATAKDLGEPGRDNRTGAGLIDAAAAVRKARSLSAKGDRSLESLPY